MKKYLFPALLAIVLTGCSKPAEKVPQNGQIASDSIVMEEVADTVCAEPGYAEETDTVYAEGAESFVVLTDVVPDVILEIRYFSTFNFVGERLPGYEEPVALFTRQAADSLRLVNEDLKAQGYMLKIFDAYRPQSAVDRFVSWARDTADVRMKEYFYPELDKSVLIPDYIARKSGHSRGSTIDLTLFDMALQKEVDMGCTFDYFGIASHADVQPGQPVGAYKPITSEQYRHRMILRRAMVKHGFKPYDGEWWHFMLRDEPFPSTYFNFPVSVTSVPRVND